MTAHLGRPSPRGLRRFWGDWTFGPIAVGAIGLIAASFLLALLQSSMPILDAHTYLAAGQALNSGGPLYEGPDPLLSPPLIAVVWRPLAALPSPLGLAIWWAGEAIAVGGSLWWLLRSRMPSIAVGTFVLAIPIGFELAVGNMNGYLLAGAILVWSLRGRTLGGVILGVMVSAKLLPALLLIWLIGQRAGRGVAGFIVGVVVCVFIVAIGAGLSTFGSYAVVASHVTPQPKSVAAITGIGVASIAVYIAAAFVVLLLRKWPAASFTAGVIGMVFGSPALNTNWLVLLPAAFAPRVLPAPAGGRVTASGSDGHDNMLVSNPEMSDADLTD